MRQQDGGGEVAGQTVALHVRRSDGGVSTFSLPTGRNTSVLDLLFEAQRRHDRTLVFRYSCRIGVCGSCAVRINGREGLACRTRALDVGPSIDLEPLRHLPVVRDLAVDLTPFWAALALVSPALSPTDEMRAAPNARAPSLVDLAGGTGDCITCAACFSACERVETRSGYPGAAAFIRAASLISDPRDAVGPSRLAALSPWLDCPDDATCTDICPKGLRHLPVVQWLRQLIHEDEPPMHADERR
jgi:succinate dehydrogenase/fumarate reductase iron-sulfur protein